MYSYIYFLVCHIVDRERKSIEQEIWDAEDIARQIAECKEKCQEDEAKSRQSIMEIRNQFGRETAHLKVEIKQLNDQLKEIIRKLDSKQTELKNKEQKLERQIKAKENQLQAEQQLKLLERNPKYKTQSQIDKLRRELEQMGFGTGTKEGSRKENDNNCSICFENPMNVGDVRNVTIGFASNAKSFWKIVLFADWTLKLSLGKEIELWRGFY